jgi:hypothetical protein
MIRGAPVQRRLFPTPKDFSEPADPVLLEYEDDGRIAIITLNRPPFANSVR